MTDHAIDHRTVKDAFPILVSTRTAARMMDTSQPMIWYWIKKGHLPARKIGKSWRIAVRDIHAIAGSAH